MQDALKFYRDLENERRKSLGLELLPEASVSVELPSKEDTDIEAAVEGMVPKEEQNPIMVDGGFKTDYSAVAADKPTKKRAAKK